MRRSLQACLLLLALPASAQIASQVRDINSSRYDNPWPSAGDFYRLEAAGGRLYMQAEAGGVWVSDGTPAGTELLRDLCPGPCSEESNLLGGLGKLMLWLSDADALHRQLWRSDGTRPGTFALTGQDLDVWTVTSEPHVLHTVFRDALYFQGCSGSGPERDCDLWRSDGTLAGTRIVHEAPRSISWMHAAGDRLYYRADDDQGADLWVTDGTAAGTLLLRRFPGEYNRPFAPVSVGRRLFVIAWDDDGEEVWTSDATAAGTRTVTDFPSPRPFESSEWLKADGDHVYFVADDVVHAREIWRTDGTAAGTVRMTEFGYDDPFDSGPSSLAVLGETLIFYASDGLSPSRMWTSRGGPGSTAPLPMPCEDCGTNLFGRLVESGGKVYYIAEDGLWVTDGTASGTRVVNDLCGSCSSRELRPWHGGVLFVPHDGFQDPAIWFSDGTAAGTKRVAGFDGAGILNSPLEVAEVGGKLYFLAESDDAGSLWVADSPRSSRPVFTFPRTGPSSDPRRLAAMGDRVVFTAWDGDGFVELWSSAGTAESTAPVGPVPPELDWYGASSFVHAAGLLFFQVGNTYEEHDLWRTDGTAQGTIHLAHLQARAAMVPFQGALYAFAGQEIWRTDGTVAGTVRTGTYPEDLEVVENAVPGPNGIYLKTVTAPYKTEFWFSDGTTAGTRQFTSFNSGGVGGGDVDFVTLGPWVYYSWDFKLWRTDGTPSGTSTVDMPLQYAFPTQLFSHQGALYFFIHGPAPAQRLQLWRLDGTGAGVVQIGDFPYQDAAPLKLTPFAGRLFFQAGDDDHGIELWSTDGTAAGTALVKDLFPGPRSSKPEQLTVAGGRLFFTAGDDVHGIELWQSDGTAAGTRLVHDIAPQTGSSSPEQLTVAGDKLFFTADDGLTGRELWVVPLGFAPAGCVPSATRLCLDGGRYAVEAAWKDFQGNQGAGKAVSLTADTGWFWFFGPENVEVILKVLDGRGLNDHVWVFYGALSNVEYTLTVTDTETGLSRRYLNPSGQLASVGDTRAFGPLGAASRTGDASTAPPSPGVRAEKTSGTSATAACQADARHLCLNGGRFAVEVAWKDFQGKTGVGTAVALTGDTGWFWFFDPANVEVVIKVLDGTPVNGRHWVFYGALSNVEYTITVTDTATGAKNVYKNPSGRFASVADTGAF